MGLLKACVAHDALYFVELDRVQGVGHLDMGVAFALDRDD